MKISKSQLILQISLIIGCLATIALGITIEPNLLFIFFILLGFGLSYYMYKRGFLGITVPLDFNLQDKLDKIIYTDARAYKY
jgi:hypothetical protein